MGTAIDIDVRGVGSDINDREVDALLNRAFARLSDIEQTFSTFIADSEVSRLGRGEIDLDSCGHDVRFIVDLCEKLHASSNGFFDIYAAAKTLPARELQKSRLEAARPMEPSGVVKGWAIEQAADIVLAEGVRNFCINAGGDIFASGEPVNGQGWRIGLQHPYEKMQIMAVLEVRDTAIATSGLYERGAHIVGADGAIPRGLVSLTVVGTDMTLTDAYATAAFAMGASGITWAAGLPGFAVFAVDDAGTTHRSAGIDAYLSSS